MQDRFFKLITAIVAILFLIHSHSSGLDLPLLVSLLTAYLALYELRRNNMTVKGYRQCPLQNRARRVRSRSNFAKSR